MAFDIIPYGQNALLIKKEEDLGNNRAWIYHVFNELKTKPLEGLVELIPGANDIACCFQFGTDIQAAISSLIKKLAGLHPDELLKKRKWRVPVCYDEAFAYDKKLLVKELGMDWFQIVQLHASEEYELQFHGFLPGFPYMGRLHPQLWTSRHRSPRKKVEAGSVGIALGLTGIYPFNSPGGWKLIGRTPLPMMNIEAERAIINFELGDIVNFVQIGVQEFHSIKNDFIDGKITVDEFIQT